ncbi:RluA family pseudouridine synthase [Mycoplasma sp. ES3225-GEN-MYC]|uniref:RNA pseudouridylate synthase n=1 Tax=Mycoplasma miroungigenitalium TaxID=754515 RepID=A0A6M4J8X5_9MOLU|nr:RluA family pseudouridine synthase [Mycoplasma miroungigenitalium]MBU4691638.1 RluA family pseudouridine synthase [Mycoplasma miroungigenitalium]QJR43463.1 RluA family pseudouridine synthase [Mycoplasma miroungigenitalium]
MAKQEFIATSNDQGRKLLKFLTSIYKNVPISKIHKVLRKGDIRINSKRNKDPNYIINSNDLITIYGLNDSDAFLLKSNPNLTLNSEIIYEDENILLINKLPGVEVHSNQNSLDQQVYSYLSFTQNTAFKPSHVGRLDKLTSGLIIYAKNYESLVQLNSKQDSLVKKYLFIPEHHIEPGIYSILTSKDDLVQKMVVAQENWNNAKLATTKIEVIDNQYFATLLSGRKHQIRLTCANLQAPVLGDIKYGAQRAKRLYLHSYSLEFKNLEGCLEYLNNKKFKAYPINWIKEEKWKQ